MNEIKANTWPFQRGKEWETDLRKQLAEYFTDKEYQVYATKGYILKDHTDWHKNIILDRVIKHIENQKDECYKNGESFPLHKWIHHGLSSQAFLFNLLGPLLVDKQWHIFDEILHQSGIKLSGKITGARFEVEDRGVFNEQQSQPTSIDLCLYTKAGEDVFIEFKFTEKNFGGCSVFNARNCNGINPANNFGLCYLHQIGRWYWQLMEKHGLLTEQIKNDSQCLFSTLYQLYRVILFALEKKGHFLLLYDERNPSFLVERNNIKRGLFNLVYETLPRKVQSRCRALPVQSVFTALQKYPELTWTNELKGKYFG